MNKTLEALIVCLITAVISYLVGSMFFRLIVDTLIVPIIGLRPVLAATNMAFFIVGGFYLVDSKYHFEQKGGKLFKDFKLFKK